MVDDQSQAPTAQLMGSESSLRIAPGATPSVTGTIGARLPYDAVMRFNFVYSCGLGQFDSKNTFFEGGARVARNNGPRSSFFMRLWTSAKKSAGF
jgi:hypothetical protein